MKFIRQRRDDDCLQACLASYFDIDINDIPDFGDNISWNQKLSDWICCKFNKFYLPVKTTEYSLLQDSIIICTVQSNCETGRHAVLQKNGKIIFDPMIGEVNVNIEPNHECTLLLFCDCK